MSWYALQVTTSREADIARMLRERGIQAIAPTRSLCEKKGGDWHTAQRTAMPGYVFVKCEMTTPLYYHLMRKPGVIKLLGREGSTYTAIPDEQMQTIQALYDKSERLAGMSHGRRGEDGEIEITDGPLLHIKQLITGYDLRRRRATVSISLYDEHYSIDMALIINDDKQA